MTRPAVNGSAQAIPSQTLGPTPVITGFNTDIQHEGVTYHVQTEDKGLKTPLLLSLVYVGGTIIASKRTPYQDLVDAGFDEQALTERLQRQHKLICAAIRAGRIEELKKMGDASAGLNAGAKGRRRTEQAGVEQPARNGAPDRSARQIKGNGQQPANTPPVQTLSPSASSIVTAPAAKAPGVREIQEGGPEDVYHGIVAVVEPLRLTLLDDGGDFTAGQRTTLKIRVGRGGYGQDPVTDAEVTVKVLGTSFRPLVLKATTDRAGFAVFRVLLPLFTSGRAAVIIRAESDGESVEERRIIQHP